MERNNLGTKVSRRVIIPARAKSYKHLVSHLGSTSTALVSTESAYDLKILMSKEIVTSFFLIRL